MKKCIVKYKEDNENYICYCNFSEKCYMCTTKDLRKDDKCDVVPGGFCTCRKCGERLIKEKN